MIKRGLLIASIILITAGCRQTGTQYNNNQANQELSTPTLTETNNYSTESSTKTIPTMTPATPAASTEQLLNVKPGQKMYATLSTSKGDIKVELYVDKAPLTVANFVGLAEGTKPWTDPKTSQSVTDRPLYQNLIFHRVIKDFMIQGGDPLGNGMGGPGYKFQDETNPQDNFSEPGILAMANSGPNTNGSQFFITHAATPWLNGKHTIFGKVVEGMDVLNAIATTPTNNPQENRPVEPITLSKITVERN